jgi:hypothetical protein
MHNPFSTYLDTQIMHNPGLCKMSVTNPTIVRDDQVFGHVLLLLAFALPLLFCLSLQKANTAIIVASTNRPAYARKNLQLVQVNTIRMLSSLIEYDAVVLMVVCDPRHLSFVP